MDRGGEEVQQAVVRNDYHVVSVLSRTSCSHEATIYDKNGSTRAKVDWTFQRDAEPAATTVEDEFNPTCCGRPDSEVVVAVWGLKRGKVANMDEIPLEKGSQDLMNTLINLVNECWSNAAVPEDWRRGTIIRLQKKVNLSDYNNWQGITLLSVQGKVLCTILLNGLWRSTDERLQEEQAGFRRGRSCNRSLFYRLIIVESLEYQHWLSIFDHWFC